MIGTYSLVPHNHYFFMQVIILYLQFFNHLLQSIDPHFRVLHLTQIWSCTHFLFHDLHLFIFLKHLHFQFLNLFKQILEIKLCP